MSADLERSYRRVLAWYPRSWREKNTDVMVGTLLDVAEAEHRTRPRRIELVGLAASGLSARFGTFLEPSARNAISTIALATGVAYPLAYFVLQWWSILASTTGIVRVQYGAPLLSVLTPPGPIIAAVWALAFAFALTRRRRGLKSTVTLAILASVWLIISYRLPDVDPGWYGLTTTSMVFLALLGVLALIGTPARGMRLLIPTGIAFSAISGSYFVTNALHQSYYLTDQFFWRSFSGSLILLLIIATLAVVVLNIARRGAAAQTVAISTIPWALVVLRFAGSLDLWNALALLGIAALLVGFGALLPLAFRRASAASLKERA